VKNDWAKNVEVFIREKAWLESLKSRNVCFITYEGWNFNSGNYLFTTDTK